MSDDFLNKEIFSFTYRDVLALLMYELNDRKLTVSVDKQMLERFAEQIDFTKIDNSFIEEVEKLCKREFGEKISEKHG
jgi:hypothetical protein